MASCVYPANHRVAEREEHETSGSRPKVAILHIDLCLYCDAALDRPAQDRISAPFRLPRLTIISERATCSRRAAVQLVINEALQRRATARPLVGCYAELAAATGL